MTWTYDPTQLLNGPNTQLMQVRYLIGDTMPGKQQVQDEEILFSISQYPNVNAAAAQVCRALAAKYATQVDLVQGELKTNYSQMSRRYAQIAADLERRGLTVVPIAGGVSLTDKANVAQDTDRVPPDFNRGQFDDLLPVGPVGQQTPTPGMPDSDQFP